MQKWTEQRQESKPSSLICNSSAYIITPLVHTVNSANVYIGRYDFSVTEAELESLSADFGGMYKVPDNFEATVTPFNPQTSRRQVPDPQMNINPQTTLICQMLGITDPFAIFSGRQPFSGTLMDVGAVLGADDTNTSDSLDVDDRDEGILDDSDFVNSTLESSSSFAAANSTFNPDEISLDDLDDDDGAVPASAAACEPPTKRQSFSPSESQSTSETELPTDNSEDIISDAVKSNSPDREQSECATSVVRPVGCLKRRNFAIYNAADSSNDSDWADCK